MVNAPPSGSRSACVNGRRRGFVLGQFRNAALGAVAALCALGAAASASALTVTNVSVFNWNTVAVDGHGSPVSTGIVFNNSLLVFCVDLEHNIGVTSYDPGLVFTEGLLTETGGGAPIDEATSNRIGQIAKIGAHILALNGPDFSNQLSAVQAAIWSLEYNTTVSFSGGLSYLNADVAHYASVSDNGTGYAKALIAHGTGLGGVQNMVPGVVPEPMSWALMITGFGLAGVVLRRRAARAQA